MASTTPERVKAMADHLAAIPTETLEMYIEDAALDLRAFRLGGFREKAERYLAAHLGTLGYPRPQSQSVSDMSETARGSFTEGLKLTEYGQEVLRILKRITPRIRMM